MPLNTATGHTGDVAQRGSARRALVVDDDPFIVEVLRDLLEDLGVRSVTTAADGAEGLKSLEQAAEQRPDVVLCDLNMPGSDGFLFMEALGERHFRGGVILVSGTDARTMNSATLMARFHRLNILATLSKPVSERALADALAKLK